MSLSRPWRAAVVAGMAVSAPCAAQWQGTVRDSAGVTIVENTGRGAWGAAQRWTLREELRIGSLEGDPDYEFGQVGGMDVDSRGRIFVVDIMAQNVRVYSPEGDYLQTIGGPGSGPGEMGPQAGTCYVVRGDTLLVPDLGQQRVNRYAPDGSSLGSFPVRIEAGIPLAINVTGDGLIAEQIRPIALGYAGTDSMDIVITLGPDGTVTDTLMRFPRGGTFDFSDASAPRRTIGAREPSWALTDDGRIYFGMTDAYRIGVYSPEGALERVFTRPSQRRPITDRDEEMLWDAIEEQIRRVVPPQQFSIAMQQINQLWSIAEFWPAFAGITEGPNGSVWVQHIQSPSSVSEDQDWNPIEDIGARDWDVFDADGRYLGIITMPPRFAPRMVEGNKVYGVWRDEYDVQYVKRFVIQGAPGGR